MFRWLFKPSLTLLCVVVICAAQAATYRVDGVAGSDTNDGVNAAFKTIARGLKDLKPGDTLLLTKMDQPYRESIPLKVHGTPQAQIVIDGGGATISGSDPAPKEGWVEANGVWSVAQKTEVKFLFGPECRYEMAAGPEALKAEEWAWKEGRLYFRPAEGKSPGDYQLEMSVRISGIMTNGPGQIIVRNLTAIHFWNDGFNIHGGSAPMWFENIRGLWNGDEGFSAHENCECYVRNGEFSHNYWHGIADVGIARTHYQNVVCRDNRSKGVYLIGAMHSLTDCEVAGSPDQIVLSPSDLAKYPHLERLPLKPSLTNLRNVVVRSGPTETGVTLTPGAAAVIEHCVLQGGKVCLQVADQAQAYLINSIVYGGQTAEVATKGSLVADGNLYFPGRLTIGTLAYQPAQFAEYVAATGNDETSVVAEPTFEGSTLRLKTGSVGAGAALNQYGTGGPDIGLEAR